MPCKGRPCYSTNEFIKKRHIGKNHHSEYACIPYKKMKNKVAEAVKRDIERK